MERKCRVILVKMKVISVLITKYRTVEYIHQYLARIFFIFIKLTKLSISVYIIISSAEISSLSLESYDKFFGLNNSNSNMLTTKTELKEQDKVDEVNGYMEMITPVLLQLPGPQRRHFMWKTIRDLIDYNTH